MKHFFDMLWYGDAGFHPDCRQLSKESKELMCELLKCREQLEEGLTKEQERLLDRLDEQYAALMCQCEKEAFFYAFCLGGRMMQEVMDFDGG